jgi:hypothetical protein
MVFDDVFVIPYAIKSVSEQIVLSTSTRIELSKSFDISKDFQNLLRHVSKNVPIMLRYYSIIKEFDMTMDEFIETFNIPNPGEILNILRSPTPLKATTDLLSKKYNLLDVLAMFQYTTVYSGIKVHANPITNYSLKMVEFPSENWIYALVTELTTQG